MRLLTLFLLSLCLSISALGQVKRIFIDKGCNFSSAVDPQEIIYSDPTVEVKKILQEILNAANIKEKNFNLVVGNVKNAKAAQKNGVRYIFFSQQFLDSFKQKSLTRMSAYFLFAHEIGHHVLNHNFDETNKNIRFRNEFQADTFATRVLVNLNATYDETLAGIKTYETKAASDSHPDADARAEFISDAYRKYASIIPPPDISGSSRPPCDKFLIQLANECFRYRYNIIKKAVAEVDCEKLTVKFELPQEYQNKRFKVCFVSNDVNTAPGTRTPGSVKGIGYNLSYSPTMTIVWNYRMENYKEPREITKPNLFSIYVFDMDNLPSPSGNNGSLLGAGLLTAAGVGLSIWGGIEMSNGKHIYNNDYKNTLKESDYKLADGKYIKGQYIVFGGALLTGVGTYLLVRKLRLIKKDKDVMCLSTPNRLRIEPVIITSSTLAGGGIRFTF